MDTDTNLQRLLHLVESAQRAGYSETQIVEIVDDAMDVDAELDDAA
jgi:hypothetical protein